jgi:hypothetical protein
MNKILNRNSNGYSKELRKLEEKAKQERLSIEEYRKILGYRFSLRLINEEHYWNECV